MCSQNQNELFFFFKLTQRGRIQTRDWRMPGRNKRLFPEAIDFDIQIFAMKT